MGEQERRWSDVDRELVADVLWRFPSKTVTRSAAAAVLDALTAAGWVRPDPDEPHLIEFRTDGWTIQHPLRCRPDLFACEINRVGEQIPGPPKRGVGVYECDLEDGVLVIGRRREDGGQHAG